MNSDDPEDVGVKLSDEEQAFKQELLQSANELDKPDASLQASTLAEFDAQQHKSSARGRHVAFSGLALGGLAAAAAVALYVTSGSAPIEKERLENEVAQHSLCVRSFKAPGAHPLIDDFEDGDGMVLSAEGRSRPWLVHYDTDKEGEVLRVLTPNQLTASQRTPSLATSNRALRIQSPKLEKWGAVLELSFDPHLCYDASAYAGLSFWVKGKGPLSVGAREIRVIPRRWGGGCDKKEECYLAHVKDVALGEQWRRVEVKWSELRQPGEATPALDPTKLHSIEFRVPREGTPADVWLDDVAFVR